MLSPYNTSALEQSSSGGSTELSNDEQIGGIIKAIIASTFDATSDSSADFISDWDMLLRCDIEPHLVTQYAIMIASQTLLYLITVKPSVYRDTLKALKIASADISLMKLIIFYRAFLRRSRNGNNVTNALKAIVGQHITNNQNDEPEVRSRRSWFNRIISRRPHQTNSAPSPQVVNVQQPNNNRLPNP